MVVASSEMPPIKVAENLPDLVKSAFNRARASGDVNFYPTQVALLTVNSLPFQLRFSPSLANKPRNPLPPPPIFASPIPAVPPTQKKFFNPFENPLPSMLVATVEPAHNLVLNKFAVTPEHFILATKDFQPQTHLLEEEDLHAAWACIEAYRNQGQELYVFFNSGGHSGASQPHRHLQLLPVGRMRDGLDTLSETQMDTTAEAQAGIKWKVLANELVGEGPRKKLPFRTFARRINPPSSPEPSHLDERVDLKAIYLDLYSEACQAVLGKDVKTQTEGEAKISYNLALTRKVMVLVPRLAEGGLVVSREGEMVGKIALNGTVLAGTALVKSEEEWDALRQDPAQLGRILGGIGIPWQQQTQSQELKEAPLL